MVVCPKCGRETPADTAHCEFCGASLLQGPAGDQANPFGEASPYTSPQTRASTRAGGPGGEDMALRMLVPIGRSPWAIISGYLGLFSLLFCFLGPLAIVFGVIAIVDIQRKPHLTGIPRAVIGIVLGIIGSLVMLLAILGAVMG